MLNSRLTISVLSLIFTAILSSCAATNEPLKAWDPKIGYRKSLRPVYGLTDHTVFGLHFSGGGTRAASFSYGILEELGKTIVEVDGKPKRLLDEVDYVNGVSGGSFTASYYALFGDRIFTDYEERFLKRNVQWDLISRLFWPWNWPLLISPYYDRIDLAIDFYNEHIFEGATFGDLSLLDSPILGINATDLSTGNPFRFSQEQFDFICSDLSSLTIAQAVGASAAAPVVFQPVTFNNYSGTCGFNKPEWLKSALNRSRDLSVSRWRSARIINSYLNKQLRPYVHLTDGGISDNLALRDPIQMAAETTLSEITPGKKEENIDRIVTIVVNAQTESEIGWSLVDQSPFFASLLADISNSQIDVLSVQTIDQLHNFAANWEEKTSKAGHPTKVYVIEITFHSIKDDKLRLYLNNLPTSLHLPEKDVDLLRKTARDLLQSHPEYQRLLADFSQ